MRNITVSVDDEVYRRARIRAAEQGTSLSRVVAEHLTNFGRAETAHEDWRKRMEHLFSRLDERFAGAPSEPLEPGWRNKLYDDRFDETVLGRSLKQRGG